MEDTIINVRNTVLEMLEERGFDEEQLNKNIGKKYLIDLISRFERGVPSLDIFVNSPRKAYVHFMKDISQNVKDYGGLNNLYLTISESNKMSNNDDIIFVILDEEVNDEKLYTVEDMYDNVTVFHYKKLLYNITKHRLVPKHEKLSNREKIKIKGELMIDNFNKLPVMLKSDPVSRFYNYRKNDVIKITRPSLGNMKHVVYRCVV